MESSKVEGGVLNSKIRSGVVPNKKMLSVITKINFLSGTLFDLLTYKAL